jgi:hypothetical protein
MSISLYRRFEGTSSAPEKLRCPWCCGTLECPVRINGCGCVACLRCVRDMFRMFGSRYSEGGKYKCLLCDKYNLYNALTAQNVYVEAKDIQLEIARECEPRPCIRCGCIVPPTNMRKHIAETCKGSLVQKHVTVGYQRSWDEDNRRHVTVPGTSVLTVLVPRAVNPDTLASSYTREGLSGTLDA